MEVKTKDSKQPKDWPTVSFRFPPELIDLLDEAAARYFTTRSQLVLMAVAKELGYRPAQPDQAEDHSKKPGAAR